MKQIFLEWFPFECRKTKTKAITMANHKKRKQQNEPMRTRSNRRQARENACDQVAISLKCQPPPRSNPPVGNTSD